MAIKTGSQLACVLAEIFGIDAKKTAKMTLVMEPDQLATLHVEQIVDCSDDDLKTVLKHYELKDIGESH